MAFLPRAGRHAAGPVWPLPAVPAAWHRAEPLTKQAPSTLCPPGAQPGPGPGSQWRGHQVGFPRRTCSCGAWRLGGRRKTPWTCSPSPFLPTRARTAPRVAPVSSSEGRRGPRPTLSGWGGPWGPGPGLASLAGGPGSLRDGKQIRGGGCLGTPGSGYSHRARNEEGASRMPRPRCPDCTYFLATVQPQPRPPRAARHILRGALPEASSPHRPARLGAHLTPSPRLRL